MSGIGRVAVVIGERKVDRERSGRKIKWRRDVFFFIFS
jgi:hypothetical protein